MFCKFLLDRGVFFMYYLHIKEVDMDYMINNKDGQSTLVEVTENTHSERPYFQFFLRMLKQHIYDNGGVVTKKGLDDMGVSRRMLEAAERYGVIESGGRGLYVMPDVTPDLNIVLQKRFGDAVCSFYSALFYHGLIKKRPEVCDITLPKGTNATRIRQDYGERVRVHYSRAALADFAVVRRSGLDSDGIPMKLYAPERCFLEIMRDERVLRPLFKEAAANYFAGEPDEDRIVVFGKKLGLERQAELLLLCRTELQN